MPAAWGSAGDPTNGGPTGGATLTVHNASGSGEKVVVVLPASGWTAIGTAGAPRGYRYVDKGGLAGPVTKVSVTSAGRLSLSAQGATWLYTLNEVTQGRVAVRLQLGGGDTWCTVFPAKPSPTGANDTVGKFVGQANLPIPASCPPEP